MTRTGVAIEINKWEESIRADCLAPGDPGELRSAVQRAFRTRLEVPANLSSRFRSALGYVLDHPGSMVRPRIVFQIALAYGITEARALDLAIALEYFHTASLIFDDLPCMDNAAERRGALCVHLPYGQSSAILAALALINRAYALAWSAVSSCPDEVGPQALRYLEERLGVDGILNGQALDLGYAQLPHTLSTVNRVAQRKTVSLIALTLVLPAILGSASTRELQLLERLSTFWGLAYQVADDLKDVGHSPVLTGKTGERDEHLNRPNVALVIGVPAAVERLTRLLQLGDRALQEILMVRPSLVFLREFRASLRNELNLVIESAGAIPIDRKR